MFFFLHESFYFRHELLFCCPWGPREWEQGSFRPKEITVLFLQFQGDTLVWVKQQKKTKCSFFFMKASIFVTSFYFAAPGGRGSEDKVVSNQSAVSSQVDSKQENWNKKFNFNNDYNFHPNSRDPWTWVKATKKDQMFFFLQESFYFRHELLFCCPWGPREWGQGSFRPSCRFKSSQLKPRKFKTKNLS
jgi:hypothetical protein